MKYIDREISWMSFNKRVLNCACNKDTPLNERLKFLAITGSNLDEFIAVRYATLLDERHDDPVRKQVLDKIHAFIKKQRNVYEELKTQVEKTGVKIISPIKKLDKSEKEVLEQVFDKNILPLLTPIHVGSTNEIPNIMSGQTSMIVMLKDGDSEQLNVIPINSKIKKLYAIKNKVFFIEDIISRYISKLFVNKKVNAVGYIRVIKDANIILNHDTSKFILDRMNETLLKRTFSKPIFLQISSSLPKNVRDDIGKIFGVGKNHIHTSDILDYSRFMTPLLCDKYSYKPFEPSQYDVLGERFSIFSELNERDILLHHPYDSYDTVVKFIEHAATDKNVVAIKITLYRVSSEDSPIVNALVKAAESGKAVSALIEIKARFDESRNISLINKLKYAGVNVILGLEYLKTHCKLCLVARMEDGEIKLYSHLATGNYNEKTARLYTDLSYMTAKQKIGMDLVNIFNIISGVSAPDDKLQKIFYAPVNLRRKLIKLIDREIDIAKSGKKGEIFLKMNSISDPEMVDKLYEAARKGVRITIICRGVCSIVPTKNIKIKSIVGRFLEHSRIYYFRNKGDSEYFISSADLLTRNLDKRVETLVSLKDSDVIDKLRTIIDAMNRDEYNSFIMQEDGSFKRDGGDFNCHEWFIKAANSDTTLKIPKHKK